MKCVLAGGRDYRFSIDDIVYLDSLRLSLPITEVVTGGASGADTDGARWARQHLLPLRTFPANWQLHERSAGPIRNREMAAYAQALVVFPGGRGTANMVRAALNRRLVVLSRHFSDEELVQMGGRHGEQEGTGA